MDPGETYPLFPGHKTEAPETSVVAAEAIAPKAETLRRLVLDYYRAGHTRTADEISSVLGFSVLSIRPRVSELHAAGYIEDTGVRRRNKSGRQAAVWRAVQ